MAAQLCTLTQHLSERKVHLSVLVIDLPRQSAATKYQDYSILPTGTSLSKRQR